VAAAALKGAPEDSAAWLPLLHVPLTTWAYNLELWAALSWGCAAAGGRTTVNTPPLLLSTELRGISFSLITSTSSSKCFKKSMPRMGKLTAA
jgi:hypothetical protein